MLSNSDTRFNWSNPNIHIAMIPAWSCGQFIINCLSHCSTMIPCAPDPFVKKLLDDGSSIDFGWKHRAMLEFLPSKTKGWHSNDFYESGRWLSTHPEIMDSLDYEPYPGEMVFRNIIPGMETYVGNLFRNIAKDISNTKQGFWLKIHSNSELSITKLLRNAKVISVTNYEIIQDRYKKRKSGRDENEKDPRYLKFRREYEPTGYVIDLEHLLHLDHSYFIKTMRELHEHLNLDQPISLTERLIDYKLAYMRSSGEPV